MKVSGINSTYSLRINSHKLSKVSEPETIDKPSINTIAFKGGNPRHLFHQISELSMFGLSSGGVATVGNDLFWNIDNFDRVIENIPLYNQDVQWIQDVDPKTGELRGIKQDGVAIRKIPTNLPSDHPFKAYEGMPFVTNKTIGRDKNLADFLKETDNAKSVFILEELKTSNMNWGLEKETPIGIYKAKKDDRFIQFLKGKGWSDEQIKKIDLTFTYVDATASMPKPYADGSYSYATGSELEKKLSVNWQGKAYPKEAKATAELLPVLKEKMGFDPKFITCHDGQAMPLIHYVAYKNASGEEYWKDKVVTAVGHNLGDGYRYDMGIKDTIVALAEPGEIKKIIDSKEYAIALKKGEENEFLKSLLPKELINSYGISDSVMFTLTYGEKGYVPVFTTVSKDYYKSIIENEFLAPTIINRLKNLSEKGIFDGIMNVLMDPNTSGFTVDGLGGYAKNECKIKLKDGKEVTLPKFIAFDKTKQYDIKSMRDVKRQNKISLLKRLNKDFMDSDLWNGEKWQKGDGLSASVTGRTGKKFSFIGGIDPKYIQMLENGKDVPMFVSWGRGDFQKGMDTALQSFVKFVKNTGNKDAILVMGGDMSNLKKEVVEFAEKLLEKDTDLKGRILVLNGWAPGDLFTAAGDYSILLSRFAPCELTDLESMKKGCIPIVPKVQGMNQKVFDPSDSANAEFTNGYKGQHEYYLTEEAALNSASQKEKEIYNKVKEKTIKELKQDYQSKIGSPIPDKLLAKQLNARMTSDGDELKIALQKLRDSIISDEAASSIERALKDRNSATAEKIWKNHVDLKTTWKDNGWLNQGKKSTAELYNELHYNPQYNKNLTKNDILRLDLSKLTSAAQEEETTAVSFGSKIKNFFKSRTGKWTAGIAGAVALAGAGYAYYKKQHSQIVENTVETKTQNNITDSPKVKSAEENKHLSAVV